MKIFYKHRTQVFLLIAYFLLPGAQAQTQSKSVWNDIPETNISRSSERMVKPASYRTLSLDLSAMKEKLTESPMEFTRAATNNSVEVQIPMPDGSMSGFRVVETVVMHPDLARAYPFIRTYSGQGIDDPTAVARFDFTQFGFHSMIISKNGMYFIEPFILGNTADYISYDKKYSVSRESFICETGSSMAELIPELDNTALRSSGSQLRTYRLALACTGEYAAFYGGTVSGALSGIVTSVNRCDGVYEQELGIRMVLIPNDTLIIYTDAATDPYTNGSGSTMLAQNQTTCTNVIGSANYDIGHVFSTGGGGVASLRVPCVSNSKARGVTGSAAPIGDAYDIDYVAHEMGHQFGANHTFNSITGNCSGNRSASTAYESGSGITIMAYAGICGSDNLDPHSIAYFHTVSFDEIVIYTTTGTGNTCPVIIGSGNTPPVVTSMGLNYSIPVGTPFVLTGAATDANGDALTYSWEQFDLGTAGAWNANPADAPLFRPFSPTTSAARTFPQLTDIINNTTTVGEILPSVPRTLHFRLTVRDNRMGGGGVMHPDTTVSIAVVNNGGAFSVIAPNTAITWTGGCTQPVTWNVNGTTAAPINCANVKISLSTDGGNTFPVILLASTSNDGIEYITVPNSPTSQARIKVEAVGNIFFDMSNANFTIQSSAVLLSALSTSPLLSNGVCAGSSLVVSFCGNGPANAGNVFTAQLSNSSGSFASPVNIGTLTSTGAGTINATIPGGTVAGSGYRIRVVSSNPAITGSDNGTNISILGIPAAAGSITGNATVCKGQTGVVYSVSSIPNATGYSWTLPPGASITAGTNTNSITVSYSSTASSGNVTVFGTNAGCNGTSSSLSVTVITPFIMSGTQAFSASGITINDNGIASPYPSTITVSGLTGLLTKDVNVEINGLSHTWPDDIDILLEAPTGQRVTLLSDCGGGTDLVNTNLILNDSASLNLPDATIIASGSYRPTNIGSPDNYISPGPGAGYAAPVGSSSTPLTTFNNLNPNGTWKLFVVDGFASDFGSIASWTLKIIVVVDSSVISGTSSVCAGQNGVAYSIPAVANATGYNWSLPPGASIASGANTNSITVNFSGGAASGNIQVTPFNFCGNATPSKPFPVTVNPCSITLNLKIFIEGFYSDNGLMFAVADPAGYPALCDTFTVELHDAASPYDVVESTRGTIATDGNGSFAFVSLVPGTSYYIVVRHRNSIETWSKNPVLFNSSTVSFDFTSP